MHGHRTKESYVHIPSEYTRKLIGEKSKLKFTDKFRDSFRKTMEDRGFWVKLSDKSDYQIYFKESNWVSKMFDILYLDVDREKLKMFGVYNRVTNPKGMVRDHIYSRREGFINGVFPEIIRHPINCQLLSQSQNISKGSRFTGHNVYTMLDSIIKYNGTWKEHEKCLSLIEDYKNGKRWERNQ